MAVKVTKGQLSNGTISKITCHEEHWKVSWFYEKVHNIANFGGYTAILLWLRIGMWYARS